MPAKLVRQAERLYAVFVELVRRYQFRDRDQVVCHGLSISQCYTLNALAQRESMTMTELARHLCLKLSTMTRVVDHLVSGGVATRGDDPNDRRVCCVRITKVGRAVVARVRSELVAEYEAVLRTVPAASREAVIDALSSLLEAFQERQRRQTRCLQRRATGAPSPPS
jgi:DNA-binding MarR family transcriptional regulator